MDPKIFTVFGPTAVTVATIAAIAFGFLKWAVPTIRRVGHLLDDLMGEPERHGAPPRPGLMERMNILEARTKELIPNSGSSIKDTINRVDERLRVVERKVDEAANGPS